MNTNKRKPLSKKTRFEVFKRDFFTCHYCGRTPPTVVLEVDHIVPVSKNGTDQIDNLLTSCFDCNRGKSNIDLGVLPLNTSNKIEILKEKEAQYKEYQNILSKVQKRLNAEVEKINDLYSSYFTQYELSDNFKTVTVKPFLEKLGYIQVSEAMNKACLKCDSLQSLKYFCGICWNMIKGGNNE